METQLGRGLLAKVIGGGGIAFWALLLGSLASQQPEYSLSYLVIFVIAVMLIVSGSAVFSGRLPWYSPHVAFVGSLFLVYVMATSAVIHYRVGSEYYRRVFTPQETLPSLLIVLVAIGSYLLGWRLGPKKQTMPRRLEWFLTDTPAVRANFDYVCFAMMAVGFAAWFYIFSFVGGIRGQLENLQTRYEGVHEAGGIFLHIANLTYAGVLFYFSRHGLNLVSKIVIPFFFLILLVFGSRSYAGMLILGVLAIYGFRFRGKIPMVWWVVIITILFLLMTFWVLMRRTAGDVGQAAQAYGQSMSTVEGAVMQSLGNLMFFRSHVEWTKNIGGMVPVQWGETFLVLLKIIPNRIWASKEEWIVSGSQLYLQIFYPHKIGNVSLACPLIIEFYLNFLYPGVVILSFLCGMTIRWLDSVLIRHPHRRYQVAHIVICGLMIGISVKIVKQGVSQGIVVWYHVILPLLFIYFPNIPLALSPPPDDAAVELGDVPHQTGVGEHAF